MSIKQYRLEDGSAVSASDLKNSLLDVQLNAMKTWFYDHFEDPVHHCPRDENGYMFLYGGPYDAMDKLGKEFADLVHQNVIEQLANELSDKCAEWSGVPKE